MKAQRTSESERLKAEAISLGLCEQWQSEWGSPSKDELCEKYIKGLDFCIKNNFPDLSYMKARFDGVMQKHGIFVDERAQLVNPLNVVANGSSECTVSYDGYSVGQIYVRHSSVVKVAVRERAVVNIRCYDNAVVEVACTGDDARVCVILRGGNVRTSGNVRIIDRRTCKQ